MMGNGLGQSGSANARTGCGSRAGHRRIGRTGRTGRAGWRVGVAEALSGAPAAENALVTSQGANTTIAGPHTRQSTRPFGSAPGIKLLAGLKPDDVADYCHLMIPMRFEPLIYPVSADGLRVEDPETGEPFDGNDIGWIDPRALDEDGDLLSPQEMAQYDGELQAHASCIIRARVGAIGALSVADQCRSLPIPWLAARGGACRSSGFGIGADPGHPEHCGDIRPA
jgi:hypothetical protein